MKARLIGVFWWVAVSAWAQIPQVGTPITLEVATWNVTWFGDPSYGPSDEARQQANVRQVLKQSAIDLWALQEVANPAAFWALLDSLGSDYEGILGQNASPAVTQRLAFVYRRSVVQRRRTEQLLSEFAEAFAYRPPLLLEANIRLPDTTLTVIFITLHLKSGSNLDDYRRRQEAAQRLKNRLDLLYPNRPVVVLGDWNDELHGSIISGLPSPFEDFRTDTAHYRFLTETLDAANLPTWCGSSSTCRTGSTLDHMLITDELFGAYEESSTDRFTALLEAIPGYVFSTSDHLPVYARFQFSRTAAVGEALTREPWTLHLYPNPARTQVTLRWERRGYAAQVGLWDVLGREVARHLLPVQAGMQALTLSLEGFPAGVYLVEVCEGGRRLTQPLVRLP